MKRIICVVLSLSLLLSLLMSSISASAEVSDIKAIKFEFSENAFLYDTQGYETGGGYWYNLDDIKELFNYAGNKLTVTNNENESVEYICDGEDHYTNDNYGDIWYIDIHWELLSTDSDKCTVNISYNGCETESTIKIKQNLINSIEYIPVNSVYTIGIEAYADADGYSVSDFFRNGDQLSLEMKDGSKKVFTYNCYEYDWADAYGNLISEFFGNKKINKDNYYQIGENNVQFSYCGIEFPVTVIIKENDIKGISYITNKDRIYYDFIEDGASYQNPFILGDKLIVNKEESSIEYTYVSNGNDKYAFEDSEGNNIERLINCDLDISNCCVNIEYASFSTQIPLTVVKKSTIDHIEFTPNEISINGKNKMEDSDLYDVPYPENAELKVCFKNGTSTVYTFDETNGYKTGENGELLLNSSEDVALDWWNPQYDNPWTIPGEYEILFYFGDFTVPVTVILDNNYEQEAYRAALDDANALLDTGLEQYEADSTEDFRAEVVAAQDDFANAKTQAEIDAATARILAAISNLRKGYIEPEFKGTCSVIGLDGVIVQTNGEAEYEAQYDEKIYLLGPADCIFAYTNADGSEIYAYLVSNVLYAPHGNEVYIKAVSTTIEGKAFIAGTSFKNRKATYNCQYSMPDGATFVETGIVMSFDKATTLEIGANGARAFKANKIGAQHEYSITFNISDNNMGKTIYGKCYFTYINKNGETKTVYSEQHNIQLRED